MNTFFQQVQKFNEFYKLPAPSVPTLAAIEATQPIASRLEGFFKTLQDELNEVNDLPPISSKPEHQLDFLVAMADWLGDIIVYCATEAAKYGIPLEEVLSIIMESNMSKVDANGNCHYDENGKVTKNYPGCQYWKPEPKIEQLLATKMAQTQGA